MKPQTANLECEVEAAVEPVGTRFTLQTDAHVNLAQSLDSIGTLKGFSCVRTFSQAVALVLSYFNIVCLSCHENE